MTSRVLSYTIWEVYDGVKSVKNNILGSKANKVDKWTDRSKARSNRRNKLLILFEKCLHKKESRGFNKAKRLWSAQ